MDKTITTAEYKRHTQKWWLGKRVRLASPVGNGYYTFPMGMEFVIYRKYNGFELREIISCPHCGKGKICGISCVEPQKLILIDNTKGVD